MTNKKLAEQINKCLRSIRDNHLQSQYPDMKMGDGIAYLIGYLTADMNDVEAGRFIEDCFVK